MEKPSSGIVVLTDRAWPDDTVERAVLQSAGYHLRAGPATPGSAESIADLLHEHRPAAVLTCWAPVTAQALANSPNLRVVTRMGVGLDNIDVAAATDRGVLVTNVPDYCVPEVSDHAVALVLAWARGIVSADRNARAGAWTPDGVRLARLAALTCGIIGYGRIGRETARKLRAFGCRMLACSPTPPTDAQGVAFVDLNTLLASCDVVILHAPLTAATHHLIGARELRLMRQGSLLVNVSRGGLVDTAALVGALASGHLSGAGLDVLESEPEIPVELRAQPAAVITPHIAFSSEESVIELRRRAAEDVVRVLRGETARNPCNQPRNRAPEGI